MLITVGILNLGLLEYMMPMYSGVQQHLVAEGAALCVAGFIICEGREINIGLRWA